jgi:hypothetical protein
MDFAPEKGQMDWSFSGPKNDLQHSRREFRFLRFNPIKDDNFMSFPATAFLAAESSGN